ncbi:MAG: membrane protein [Chloroflexota bacterium]|nr:membrane protein [Chloroflexota bacterium]
MKPPAIIAPAPPARPATTPPAFTWDYAGRVVMLVAGLFAFALGIVCNYKAAIGLGPWDCFHLGLSLHLPITPGQASELTGALIIICSWAFGVRPGVGTIANMVLVGQFFDVLNTHLPSLADAALPWRIALQLLGIAIIGFASGLYIRANLGAGPRDSLMLALTRRTGQRVAVVRGAVEVSVLGFGFLLGGTVGLGTLIYPFAIGPAVEAGFRLFRVQARH